MKIVTEQMPRHSTSVNCLDVNSFLQPVSVTDVDQLKEDLKIFPEEHSNPICNAGNADPLPFDMKDYTMELLGDDCSVVKESQTEVGFDDPFEICRSEVRADMNKDAQSSANANSIDLELVSQACSRETDDSTVRDIWIDDGFVPLSDKNFVEVNADGLKFNDDDYDSAKDMKYGSDNAKVEVDRLVPAGLKSMTDEATEIDFNSLESKILVLQSEATEKDFNSLESKILVMQRESDSEKTDLNSSDLQKDKDLDTVVAEDTDAEAPISKTSTVNRCNDEQYTLRQESVTAFEVATDKLICSSCTSEATSKEISDDMKLVSVQEEISNHFLHKAVNRNEVEHPLNAFDPQLPDSSQSQMPEQQNVASDHLTTSARIQRDHFESSFASAGHYSNSIANTGSVAYSGSLSHRSDASTVSTRSFAFPVLQNEWNFSPVRMRKADRRHLGRRRGWMNGLFCCKF